MAEYRRFIASSLAEAKQEMIKKMGVNAYIVKTQKITKKSMFGLKKTHLVEIQAGKMGERTKKLGKPLEPSNPKRAASKRGFQVSKNNVSFLEESLKTEGSRKESIEKIKELVSQKYTPHVLPLPSKVEENHLDKLSKKEMAMNAAAVLEPDSLPSKLSPPSLEISDKGKATFSSFLEDREFSNDFINWVASRHRGPDPDSKDGKENLADFIASQFRYAGAVKVYASNPNIVVLVGPTGIGKTTTMAKIASHYAVGEGRSCVLATFDVRRIMATAQLEKFALIMETPFRILRQKSDLKRLISEFIEKNLIFIDTAGTSHHDKSYLEEMGDFISYISIPKEIHLGINATLRIKEMEKIIDHFQNIRYDRVIITKCDESENLGPALSVLHRYNLPISYLATGQDVPTHFVLASKDIVCKQLMKEWT